MRIDAFKTMLQTQGSGRVTTTDAGTSFSAISNRLGGKLAGARDFIVGLAGMGKTVQQRENMETRLKFANALKESYGNALPGGLLDKIISNPTKDLKRAEIKSILVKLEKNDTPIVVRMPGAHGGNVNIPRGCLPPEVLAKTPNIAEALTAKLERGYELARAIRSDDNRPQGPATKQQVNDLAWYLHVASEAKVGRPYRDGATTLTDTDHRLFEFMDSCPESYRRESTHIEGFVQVQGGGHRGIDFPAGKTLDTVLPHGLETVLFGRMTPSETTPLGRENDQKMTFLKLESHGCRLWKLSGNHRDQNKTDRPLQGHDLRHQLGHMFSFLATQKARSTGIQAEDTQKERIPADILKDYETLVSNAPEHLKPVLLRNDPYATAGGVRIMLRNIEAANREQENFLPISRVEVGHDFVQNMHQRFDRHTLHLRIGNEVILQQGFDLL